MTFVEPFNNGFNQLRVAAQAVYQGTFTKQEKGPLVLVIVAIFLIAAPLDLQQLAVALLGALLYAIFTVPGHRPKPKAVKTFDDPKKTLPGPKPCDEPSPKNYGSGYTKHYSDNKSKPTAFPIKAPTFTAFDFDAQVDEMIVRITPTASCHRAVEDLTAMVRRKVQSLIPEVEVMGFATGNFQCGTAYGVAVPDFDIVANVNPMDLTKRLQGRLMQQSHSGRARTTAISRLDTHKLHKSAIRVCTSLLVSIGFKFRRSCFRSEDPKVTLLAPVSLGASQVSIPLDFSINNTTPLYHMALLTECGQMDPRAKSLILLVKRWAKDRGICHASKGHLSPYSWSLLAIYFLQAGVVEQDGGLPLPALDAFAVSSGLMNKCDEQVASKTRPASMPQKKTMGCLFKDFVRFYNREFDWRKEAVSVRLGKRAPPNFSLDIHIVLNDDGSTVVSPLIEDPFNAKKNLGSCTNASSLERFYAELERADSLLSQGISLTDILEPWRPDLQGQAGEDNEAAEKCDDDGED